MHVKLPITASVDEKEDWKLISASQLSSLLPCLQIKRANNSRNWETGVSTGVVTCTSEVRAELLQGAFRCLECGGVVKNVEQQFKYTEVSLCISVLLQLQFSGLYFV